MDNNKVIKRKKIPKFIYWCIVIFGTGFIFFTSFTLGQKIAVWTNSNIQTGSRKITVSDDKVKSLIDEYKSILQYIKEEGLSDNLKLYVVFNQLKSNEKPDSTYTCEDAFLDSKETEHRAKNDNYVCDNTNSETYISSYKFDIVNQYYKKIFGENTILEKKDYDGDKYYGEYFEYSDKLNIYVELLKKYGEASFLEYDNYYEIQNKKYDDGKLEVEITYLTYRKSNSENKNVFEYEINGEQKNVESEEALVDIYKENKDKLPKLTFNFEKENNNFILTSIK